MEPPFDHDQESITQFDVVPTVGSDDVTAPDRVDTVPRSTLMLPHRPCASPRSFVCSERLCDDAFAPSVHSGRDAANEFPEGP